MYTQNQILTGLRQPALAAKEINKQFARHVLKRLRPPIDVFEEEWDNLILLDGCRYDLMKEYELKNSRLESKWSGGSHSKEFLKYNVAGKNLNDVVWVTANPWVSEYEDNIYSVKNVWDTGWNKEHQTVLPETMKVEAMSAASEFPNKRLVVHFMQPHYPFIGKTGKTELPQHRTFTGDGIIKNNETVGKDIWDHLRNGRVKRKAVWKAYKENLDLALPYVRQLAENLTGKTVVSADHGNEFGGRCFPIPTRLYGHPEGYRTKNLVRVPWIICKYERRKSIEPGKIRKTPSERQSDITDRLEQLGYR